MPVEYEIDSLADYLTLRATGEVTLQEELECFSRWSKDPQYRMGMPILLDNRRRTAEASSEHVQKMVELTKTSESAIGKTRCAIVVASDVEYGMARMFSLMSDPSPVSVMLFRDIDEARDWLIGSDSSE